MTKKRVFSVLVSLVMFLNIVIAPNIIEATEQIEVIAQFITNEETTEVNSVSDFISKFNGINEQSGETKVTLLKDIELGEILGNEPALKVQNGSNVTLDLNGNKISSSLKTDNKNYANVQVICNEGNLIISDESGSTPGIIENVNPNSNPCTRTIKNNVSGNLLISNVEIRTQMGVGLLNLGLCSIENSKVESLKEGQTGGWDNAVAAIEQRGDKGSVLTVNSGNFISKSQSAIFCDEPDSRVVINGGNFVGNSAYTVFNGGSAEDTISVRGGQFNTDPSTYVDEGYYAFSTGLNSYSIGKQEEIKKVALTEGELSTVLSAYDINHPVEVLIKGNVTLNQNACLSLGSKLVLEKNAVLTINENIVLSLEGEITNNGIIVGNGYVSNPLSIMGNGTITGLPLVGNNYTIDSASDLQWLTYVVEYMGNDRLNVILTEDITMPNNVAFQPISSGTKIFQGNFDGKQHKIDKLTLRSESKQLAMFYSLANSTIENLFFSNVNVETDSGYTAVVVSNSITSNTFKNITIDGSIKANGASYGVAAIAAAISNKSNNTYFINCVNNAEIHGEYAYNMGSMFGTASKSSENIYIYNCSNSGNITAKGSYGYVFGYGYLNLDGKVEIIGFTNNGLVNGKTGVICSAPGSGFQYAVDYVDGSKYIAVKENNIWKAAEKNTVQAIVNGDYYLDADTAIEQAKDGETVELLNSSKLDKNHTIQKSITVVDSTKESFAKLTAGTNYKKTVDNNTCVFRKLIMVDSITINKSEIRLEVGTSETLTAVVKPTNADTKIVTWTTDNEEIAKVDKTTGKVTAKDAGTTTITATAGDKSASCTVTVYEIKAPVIPPVDKDTNVSLGEEAKEVLKDVVKDVIENVKTSTSISNETREKLEAALVAGKEISVAPKIEVKKEYAIEKEVVTKIENAMKATTEKDKVAEVAQYYDLSMMLTAAGEPLGTVNELTGKVEFTVSIPKDLTKAGRKFYIVRVHEDGNTERIEGKLDGTDFSFETDKFSIFALVYEDDKIEVPTTPTEPTVPTEPTKPTTPDKPETPAKPTTPTTPEKPSVDTGDVTNAGMLMTMLLAAGFVGFTTLKRRNRI